MQALLQCGHQTEVTLGVSFGRCPHCGAQIAVKAIECRSWKVTCWKPYCRYRGIPADSQGDGMILARIHKEQTGHPSVTYDFMIPVDLKVRMRELYGRKVRMIIDDVPVADRWPSMRTVVDIELPEDSEECPFL